MPLGAIPSIIYTFGTNTTRRSALLTDILALSFSHNALSLLKLDSFKTGCVLLSGLFFYDIWWVFGTEVVSAFLLAPDSGHTVLYRDVNSLKPKPHIPLQMRACFLSRFHISYRGGKESMCTYPLSFFFLFKIII